MFKHRGSKGKTKKPQHKKNPRQYSEIQTHTQQKPSTQWVSLGKPT